MNRADADGNGSGTGGGIYNCNTSSVTLLNNTLLAGNLLGAAGSDGPNDLTGETIDGTALAGTDAVDAFFSGKALRELLDKAALVGVL